MLGVHLNKASMQVRENELRESHWKTRIDQPW